MRARPPLDDCLSPDGTFGQPQPVGPSRYAIPDPGLAGPEGLVGYGADLEPSTLLDAYRRGIFPWPQGGAASIPWFSPDPRAVIPFDGVHIPRRLQRRVRQQPYRLTLNQAFGQVIQECSQRPEGTWITRAMQRAYVRMHELGWAHSLEAWAPEGELAGGVYGLRIGGLFAAESMFHLATDASKVALLALLAHCRESGVTLFDVQLLTPHLASLGAVEIPRPEYLRRLREAVG